jgi:hypothetical protein
MRDVSATLNHWNCWIFFFQCSAASRYATPPQPGAVMELPGSPARGCSPFPGLYRDDPAPQRLVQFLTKFQAGDGVVIVGRGGGEAQTLFDAPATKFNAGRASFQARIFCLAFLARAASLEKLAPLRARAAGEGGAP